MTSDDEVAVRFPTISTTSVTPPGPMAWNAWGAPGHRHELDDGTLRRLTQKIGPLTSTPSVDLDQVSLPPCSLGSADLDRLAEVVGPAWVRADAASRVRHAAGRSYLDLIRLRHGQPAAVPDAVVHPADHDEVVGLLRACEQVGIAVVPFGGGTSVVGGVEPRRGRFAGVIALDLGRLDRLITLDPVSQIATFEPGVRGAGAEALLRERGYTLGHFPQSYEHATLGGFVATRSAGQASTGYGRIDDLVVGVRCATPIGELRAGPGRRSAAGPDLLGLLVGSEGTLGILTEVSVQVRPAPDRERHEAWAAPSFASGAAIVRALAQGGVAPDIVRLSDEQETRSGLADAGPAGRALRGYLATRGLDRPALLILGWEGTRSAIVRRRDAAHQVLRRRRVVRLGSTPGRAWADHRFQGPYLRDALLDHGVMVDTLETAATWSRLGPLYLDVRSAIIAALTARGTPPVVLCHVSHVYRTGASLYFTWLARREIGAEVAQWDAVKQAAGDAIVAAGGTITHHHAVGLDHRPWMRDQIGDVGVAALRAAKDRLDPAGILNPDKLLPAT